MANDLKGLLLKVDPSGMTDEMWDIYKEDLDKVKNFNILSNKEFNLLFYLDHFIDDMLGNGDKKEIMDKMFSSLRGNEYKDILEIASDMKEFIDNVIKKNAYPNIVGVREFNAKQVRDVEKWIKALNSIYTYIQQGFTKSSALNEITKEWDKMEKLDFENWLKYYESSDHQKYNIKVAFSIEEPPPALDEMPLQQEFSRPKKVKTPDTDKLDLISRLDSADRLLRKFVNVWPAHVWNRLHQLLSELKREIVLLKTSSTISDRIIRTANMWAKEGFDEGAMVLYKIAQPPDDLGKQIQDALSGKKEEPKTEPPIDMPPQDLGQAMPQQPDIASQSVLPEGMDTPDAAMQQTMPGNEIQPDMAMQPAMPEQEMSQPQEQFEAPPSEAGQPMAEPEKVPEFEVTEDELGGKYDKNPYDGSTVKDVLKILEDVISKVRSREYVRQLSKVDMMLAALNIASHFPELAEAMGRALEAESYISIRVEKMINKLKGGLSETQVSEKEAPEVNMDAIKIQEDLQQTASSTVPFIKLSSELQDLFLKYKLNND